MIMLKPILLLSVIAVVMAGDCCNNGWLRYNGHCYRYVTQSKTWFDARDHCRALGADLTSIHSAGENDVVNGLVSGTEIWIGFNDLEVEGQFSWSDETPAVFTAWQTNEPNDSNQEDCAELNYINHPDGTWNDKECTDQYNYVCKQ